MIEIISTKERICISSVGPSGSGTSQGSGSSGFCRQIILAKEFHWLLQKFFGVFPELKT